ncbi:leiomodin-2 [Spea bombifrons]|uniref:leiomodin-2 n=1 Tax=Spea bombifrons TaxID=233779 RepID=UPI00234BD31A|nr:leiomodin-2 [Spea bombifrons]
MSTFGYRREISKYEDIDEDELLASLSPEELQELERELEDIEPDRNLPVGMRQKSLTEKSPTANFSREALMAYWEKETKKLLEKEQSGACEKNLEDEQEEGSEEDDFTGSNSEVSEEIYTEEEEQEEEEEEEDEEDEVVSEVEENCKDEMKEDEKSEVRKSPDQIPNSKCKEMTNNNNACNGYSRNAEKNCRQTEETPNQKTMSGFALSNPTVIDDVLENIRRNDPDTYEVNLNNIENITTETLISFAQALKENTEVKIFSLANTHAEDNAAVAIASMLRVNRSITSLNIESNFITGKGILAIMRALQYNNNVLTELRFHNQRHIMGSQVEMEIAKLLRDNTSVVKLGYHFELPGPRMSMTSILTRNMDKQRQKRMQEQKESGYDPTSNLRTKTLQRGTPGVSPYSSPRGSPWSSPKPSRKFPPENTLPPSPPLPPPPVPPPPPPPPPMLPLIKEKKIPSRNIAEVIKQHERSAKKLRTGHKSKGKKCKKEQNNILKDIKNSLRSISENKAEETSRPSTPQRSARDDLMEAIRGSSVKQLRKVDVPEYLR